MSIHHRFVYGDLLRPADERWLLLNLHSRRRREIGNDATWLTNTKWKVGPTGKLIKGYYNERLSTK